MTQDPAAIAGKLSASMKAAMVHKNAGTTSYQWASMRTLDALYARGLALRKGGLGSMFSPQTSIVWPLTPLGLSVRQAILEEQDRGE